MATEDSHRAVAVTPPDVFHVHVVETVAECADELHVIDALVTEMGRVAVETETLVSLHRGDGALCGGDVERDLGRMNFEGEVHVSFVEGFEDRAEALGKVSETRVPVRLRRRRKSVDRMPDA